MCRSETCSLQTPLLCPALVLPADVMPLHQLSKPMKSRIPRKLATSARINLNKYWSVLEELMPVGRKAFDESDTNAINENMDNERRLAGMQISDLQEGGKNSSPMAELFSNGKTNNPSQFIMETSPSLTLSENSNHLSDKSSFFKSSDDSSSSSTSSGIYTLPASTVSDPDILDENTPPSPGSFQMVSS